MQNDPFYNPEVPAHVEPERVYDFNIYDYESAEPFAAARALFEKNLPDVFWSRNNGGHWIALGAEPIYAVLNDPELFSSSKLMLPKSQNPEGIAFPPVDTDPPYHKWARAAVAPLFTPQKVEALKSEIRALCRELIAPIKERGECEFVADFAEQLPGTLFLHLMEMPLDDREKLRLLHRRIINPSKDDHRAVPLQELWDYLEPYVQDRMKHPRKDPISYILSQKVGDRDFEVEEVVKIVGTLLRGGTGTTIGMLTFFARYLAENPNIRERLRAEPRLISRAAEEILRRFPLSTLARLVTRDAEFRGVQLLQGEQIAWSVGMHNFDDRRFTDPLTVEIERSPNRHASFGIGIHSCLGQMLARAELHIFAEEWLAEIPDFHVKPGTEIRYLKGIMVSYESLPLVIGKPA